MNNKLKPEAIPKDCVQVNLGYGKYKIVSKAMYEEFGPLFWFEESFEMLGGNKMNNMNKQELRAALADTFNLGRYDAEKNISNLKVDEELPLDLFIESPEMALRYALDLGRRVPELEAILSSNAYTAFYYAENVVKGKWVAGEAIIATFAPYAYGYAFLLNDKFELGEAVIAKDAYYAYCYAKNILKDRFRIAEATIANSSEWAFYYAKDIIKGRWEDGERAIAANANWSLAYARYVLKDRFLLGEEILTKWEYYALEYALHVIKGRWEPGEKAIAEAWSSARQYLKMLDV